MGKRNAEAIEAYTERRLRWLLDQTSESVCKATLAELRRGVGRAPGEFPRLWGMLLDPMPEELQGRSMEPSREEIAAYTALTLFAVHQQGWDPKKEPMHRRGCEIGAAIAQLIPAGDEDARERIERRFTRAATSLDMAELAHHPRGLVQQLSAQGIPMDWAQLAGQLYLYQFPDLIAGVRLRWGESFYRALNRNEKTIEGGKENP